MLLSFRETYGVKMMDLPVRLLGNDGDGDVVLSGEPVDRMSIYSFPTLEQLKKQSTEEQLRGLGLGYRAKYIIQTRDLLIESGGKDYLLGLRSKDSETVQEELLKFSGIGRKVADCVALFSLDQSEAIPVDVHVQHIASRDYDPTVLGQAKSLTPTIYKRVGDLFRDRFEYAGWAHSLLFVAELPSFRNVLPEDVVAEMDAVS
jgi:N-glycosylase/DNA lyase